MPIPTAEYFCNEVIILFNCRHSSRFSSGGGGHWVRGGAPEAQKLGKGAVIYETVV